MPKTTKSGKRRRSSGNNSIEVAGVVGAAAPSIQNNSIESCLEELEALTGVQEVSLPPPPASKSDGNDPHKKKKKKARRSEPAAPTATAAGKVDSSGGKTKTNPNPAPAAPPGLLWDPSLLSSEEARSHFPAKVAVDRDVERWNAALRVWSRGSGQAGTYSPILLPCSLEVEVARHFHVEKLSQHLLKSCKTKQLKMPTFERWLIDCKIEELERSFTNGSQQSVSSDPVLCYCTPNFQASVRLAEEMKQPSTGMTPEEVKKTVKELCRRTAAAIDELRTQTRQYANRVPLRGGSGDRVELEKHDQIYSLLYRCKKWKKPYCIRLAASHYHKLREMFLRVHNETGTASTTTEIRFVESGKATKALHAFHYLVMTLLLRYSSLSGGQLLLELRGGGMQGAVHGDVFRVLRKFFPARDHGGPILECFASPLNCYVPCFGSAFPEIDYHFGSVGNFLDLSIDCGVCEANPPFSAGIMIAMVDRIEHCLAEANQKKKSLVFIVIVPTVQANNRDGDGDTTSSGGHLATAKRHALPPFQRMTDSPSCTHHIVLKAREHGYLEGAQHLRLTRYKSSIFDTSVIVLQSERSVRKCPLDDETFHEGIREAFASRHSKAFGRRREEEEEEEEDVDDDSR